MHRLALVLLPLAALVLSGTTASAAVKKYNVFGISISEAPEQSPNPMIVNDPPTPPFDVTFIDDSVVGSPVLKKFRFKSLATTTVNIPGFAGGAFIFIANNFLEGPGGVGPKPNTFTGTGHTAAGSTISWGIVTGWSITGSSYCRSSPPVICSFANLGPSTTTDPEFNSDFYDLGTWSFHATGFTGVPFVHRYSTNNFGNNQRWVRGWSVIDATVPALPLLGLVALGGSLAVGAVTALRRQRRK